MMTYVDMLGAATVSTAARRREAPDAIEVLVVGAASEDTARACAVLVMGRLHPDRIPGAVLHMERDGDGDWLVAVEDRGPAHPRQVTTGRRRA